MSDHYSARRALTGYELQYVAESAFEGSFRECLPALLKLSIDTLAIFATIMS